MFLCFADESVTPGLETQLGDLVDNLARFDFTTLRSAKQIVYEVGANWKLIAENYSECYHCPGVHPQLNKLTPYDLGGDFDPNGAWQGGWMELVEGAETMALDGGHGSRDGRPPMCGITPTDEQRVYYYVLWPTTFLSIHPDYLLSIAWCPVDSDHTQVVCDWLFEGETIDAEGFDPSDAIAFWDLTNRQDWHVCELQQRGTRVAELGRRPLLEPGGVGAGVRPDGRRPLRRGRSRRASGPSASATTRRRRSRPRTAAQRAPGTTVAELRSEGAAASRSG